MELPPPRRNDNNNRPDEIRLTDASTKNRPQYSNVVHVNWSKLLLYNTHVIETTLSILSGASNKSVTTKMKYNNETIHSSHSGATFYIPLTYKYKGKKLVCPGCVSDLSQFFNILRSILVIFFLMVVICYRV